MRDQRLPEHFARKLAHLGATLMHVFASLCPSPEEVHPSEFLRRGDAAGNEQDYRPDPDAMRPLIAHVFKVVTDPFVGKLGIFRVHQGVIKQKQDLMVDDQKKPIRVGHMFRLQGKDHGLTKRAREALEKTRRLQVPPC